MPGAIQAVSTSPVYHVAASRAPLTNMRSRSSSLASLALRAGDGKEIRTMLSAVSGADKSEKRKTVELARELIAIRHLFSANVRDGSDQCLSFAWETPLSSFRVSLRGMGRFLNDIAPALAADERRVAFIKDYINAGVPKENKKSLNDALKRSFFTQEMASRPPCDWPRHIVATFLQNCYWDKIDLSDAVLENIDFGGVQWPCVVLDGASVKGCNFREANLSDASMHSTIADGADFTKANLDRVKANKAFFIKTIFSGARARNADFSEAHLEYSIGLPCEQGITLADAELNHSKPAWNLRENFLLASGTAEAAGQLRTLSSIHPRHDKLHNDLVWRLVDAIDRKSYQPLAHRAAMEFLLGQGRCWQHDRIPGFIDNVILPELLGHWNSHVAGDKEIDFDKVMRYLTVALPALDWPRYCGALSQLQLDAEEKGMNSQRRALCALVKMHPAIEPLAAAMTQQPRMERFEECSIFMARDLDCAVVYPNSGLAKMKEGTMSPYNGYCFRRTATGSFALDVLRNRQTIESCGVPLAMYKVEKAPAAAVELLSYIFDGSECKQMFVAALDCKSLPSDSISLAEFLDLDIHLSEHLQKFFGLNRRVEENQISLLRCERLWKIFAGATPEAAEIENIDNNDRNISRMLLCLGTLITRYSSSYLFGTETESLNSLRDGARVFLSASYEFDPSILGREGITDICDTLKGKPDFFECTGELSGKLVNIIRARIQNHDDRALGICFKAIYPQSGL